jgi:hypothetical protein
MKSYPAHEQGSLPLFDYYPWEKALEHVMPSIMLKKECLERVSHGNPTSMDYIISSTSRDRSLVSLAAFTAVISLWGSVIM